MSYSGGKGIMYSSLVVLLIISLLHIWVFTTCRVGAIRTYPPNRVAKVEEKETMKTNYKSKEDLFRKFFSGNASDLNKDNTHNALQDDKRRVPSCPDPLHNK